MNHRRFWIRFDWWMGMAFSFIGGAIFVWSAIELLAHFADRWLFQLAIGVVFILIGFLAFRFRETWISLPDIALEVRRQEMVQASRAWVDASQAEANHILECPVCRTEPLMALGVYTDESPKCSTRESLHTRTKWLAIRRKDLIDAYPWSK